MSESETFIEIYMVEAWRSSNYFPFAAGYFMQPRVAGEAALGREAKKAAEIETENPLPV